MIRNRYNRMPRHALNSKRERDTYNSLQMFLQITMRMRFFIFYMRI